MVKTNNNPSIKKKILEINESFILCSPFNPIIEAPDEEITYVVLLSDIGVKTR